MKHLFAALAAVFLASCNVTATLYPVKGELSQQKPLPVLKAKVCGVMGNSGDVSLTLPSGEHLVGRWSSIAPRQVSVTSASGTALIGSAIATVYGSGTTVSNVPGINRGTAFLTGPLGSTMEVEFWTGSGTASGNGVAVDNHGNVFKVIF